MFDPQEKTSCTITLKYRHDSVYMALERLCTEAGIKIVYQTVPDDSIDGEIWARSDVTMQTIIMPDQDCFDCNERAGLILGHEMAHIITGLGSPDYQPERMKNEAICDLLGSQLYRLAEMIAVAEAEKAFL